MVSKNIIKMKKPLVISSGNSNNSESPKQSFKGLPKKKKWREHFYVWIARLIPAPWWNFWHQNWLAAGRKNDFNISAGQLLLLQMVLMIIPLLLPFSLHLSFSRWYLLASLLMGILVFFIEYLKLYITREQRKEEVERALPDYLELVSSNLKAGLAPFQALQMAAKQDFGLLSAELKSALQKSMQERSLGSSLLEISSRVHSPLLERTLQLLVTSLKSGASLAVLLDHMAQDIRDTKNLEKQIITNTKTYTVLILFTVMFAMPALLAVTLYFLESMRGTLENISLPSSDFGLSLFMGEIVVSPLFLQVVSYSLLVITSILTSLLLGIIGKGKATLGLMYAPLLAASSCLLFYLAQYLVRYMLGTLT